jgi:hypothetical protein
MDARHRRSSHMAGRDGQKSAPRVAASPSQENISTLCFGISPPERARTILQIAAVGTMRT